MSAAEGPAPRGRILFAIGLLCSVLTVLVLLSFFVTGLGDGSVSSFNIGLWLGLLGAAALSLWAGIALHAKGRRGLAILALAVTAVPGILAGLLVLLLLVAQPRWN